MISNKVAVETGYRPLILVVDDEEPIRKIFDANLSVEGYRVLTASDGVAALCLTKEHKPDLIILDIMMPGKSGLEILQEVKAIYPDIAVVMASCVSEVTTAVNCLKKGAYDYIVKPFNVPDVLLAVKRALERRRLWLEDETHQHALQQEVEKQSKRIYESFLGAITSLAYALEAKDVYTSGHSRKVSELSKALAIELGISQDNIERICLAGLLHDIGKIGIRESILSKSGKLTDEEYNHIKSHPQIGVRILAPIVEDKSILDTVRHHHERYDGKGYPDNLQGNEIPIGASILAVADTYDALTSSRPYRGAMCSEKACKEIVRCSGSQFNSEVVESFMNICPNFT